MSVIVVYISVCFVVIVYQIDNLLILSNISLLKRKYFLFNQIIFRRFEVVRCEVGEAREHFQGSVLGVRDRRKAERNKAYRCKSTPQTNLTDTVTPSPILCNVVL